MYGALLLFESEFVHIVAISFTSLILTELLMVALTIQTWHWLMTVAELLSLACYIASLVFLHEFIGKSPTRPRRAHTFRACPSGPGASAWEGRRAPQHVRPGPAVQQASALGSPPCLMGTPRGTGPLTAGQPLGTEAGGLVSVPSVVFKPRPVPAGLAGDLFNARTWWAFSRELVTVLGPVELPGWGAESGLPQRR